MVNNHHLNDFDIDNMKLAIMQPYFLPYIGYFQLIASVDKFIIYDNIKYTKKGWVNRNRMLLNNQERIFSIPLKGDSNNLNISERVLSPDFNSTKLLNQFKGAYDKAPYFDGVENLLKKIITYKDNNLFNYINHSIVEICGYLNLLTEIKVSSHIEGENNVKLKGAERVVALCNSLECSVYINSIGGMELYSPQFFKINGIELKFLKSRSIMYDQFGAQFVPWLSIIDVLMFNSPDEIKCFLSEFDLIEI